MRSKVVLLRCDCYDFDAVEKTVGTGIELLGGAGRFARKNEKILLKPNLLAGDAPDKGTTTHPAIFRAVIKILQTTGAMLSYGDSPAVESLGRAARNAGLAQVAQDLHVAAADFKNGREYFFEMGRQNKKFHIASVVLEADGIISLPKLKTHGFQKFTGCVKNQFGCIPGTRKMEYHLKLVDSADFARMLVDLDRLVKPRLYIMDGIHAMEGNGPRGGRVKQMNALLLSQDPIALDATACRLIDLNPDLVPTIRYGHEAGAGTMLENEIELLGDPLHSLQVKDFDVDRSPLGAYRTMGIRRRLNNVVVPKPFIIAEKCVQCGICISVCPSQPKTLGWKNNDRTKAPVYNYEHCIRCYCCQEMCPESAIELSKPLLRNVVRMISR